MINKLGKTCLDICIEFDNIINVDNNSKDNSQFEENIKNFKNDIDV